MFKLSRPGEWRPSWQPGKNSEQRPIPRDCSIKCVKVKEEKN